jgi:2-keto-3-deoxy-L-rhamnonate aldolase RhmA
MQARELKAKWRRGEPTPGVWIHIGDPTVAEIIGLQHPDWIMIDAEHAALDLQTLQGVLIALAGSGAVPLVRVPSDDPVYIKRVLDMGAAGILVPQVLSAEETRRAVAACKYPPAGNRGAGPRRAGRYGTREAQYLASANDETIVLVMIESIDAVRRIDEIIAVPGLDGIVVGPLDLSASLDLLNQVTHPLVVEAMLAVAEHARAAGMPFGSGRASGSPEDIAWWLSLGAKIVAVGSADGFLANGTRAGLEGFARMAAVSTPVQG